jgi:HSP20 family molecular chaperone IbpA
MENGNLYINGSRTYKLNGDEKVKTIKKEFRIGDGYDPSSVEATIEDGLLTVFVPNFKKQEKKRISIL